MKKKNLALLVFLGLIVTMVSNCEKEDSMKVDNLALLTNGSSKVWVLSRITLSSGTVPLLPSCVRDDEICFNINGTRIRNNMGTTIDLEIQGPTTSCKDTVQLTDTAYWTLNQDQNTLSVSNYSIYYNYDACSVSQIITLTDDSLVMYTNHNTNPYVAVEQTETYYSK